MKAVNAANLAVRFFVVELGALAGAAYWGFQATSGAGQLWLAVAAPVAVILVWGMFISPRARVALPPIAALVVELVLLGLVALGVAAAGPVWLGVAYGGIALASGVLNFALPG